MLELSFGMARASRTATKTALSQITEIMAPPVIFELHPARLKLMKSSLSPSSLKA
jgi:hypothetical protein